MAKQQLSEVKQSAQALVELPHLAGDPDTYLTVLPNVTVEDRQNLLKLRHGQHALLDDYINKDIAIVGWLASLVEFTDEETGEVEMKPLTRILLVDGTMLQTTGPAVYRMLRDYHCTVRSGPWHEPARFTVRKIRSRKAGADGKPKSYFALDPIF